MRCSWKAQLRMTQQRHCPAFYVAARSKSQLYQNICLSRYDAVSSAAGGWPVNGAPPFSLPDAGDSTAVRLSAPGAVRHDVAHQVAHVVLPANAIANECPNAHVRTMNCLCRSFSIYRRSVEIVLASVR